MRSMRGIVSALVLLVAIVAAYAQREAARSPRTPAPIEARRTREDPTARSRDRATPREFNGPASGRDAGAPESRSSRAGRGAVGFRSHERLVEHFQKHGREFGAITQDEYLRRAQQLRDLPAGGDVLESVRADGVITRYDRSSGAFLAVNPDGTIRTFFRPNQGETYFRRQLTRPH